MLEVIDNLAFTKSYEQLQRQAEEEEAEYEGLDMWGQKVREKRDEHTDEATGNIVSAKPTVSVPLHDVNVQQVMSEARQARLALTVKPKNGLALKRNGQYGSENVENAPRGRTPTRYPPSLSGAWNA